MGPVDRGRLLGTEPRARVRPFGQSAAVVSVESPWAAHALSERVRGAGWADLLDAVAGLDTVTALFRLGRAPEELAVRCDLLARWAREGDEVSASPPEGRRIVLPTVFDGPDLETLARDLGLDPSELVDQLVHSELRVSFLGFTPGFAYLSGLPGHLAAVARRATPRPRVPAGSVALAGGFAAVYPSATPGGWQLVGRTRAVLFDPATPPYATLRPGDRVVLAPEVGSPRPSTPTPPPTPPPPPPPPPLSAPGSSAVGSSAAALDRRPVLTVEAPGTRSTIQDGGRPGWAHLGVGRSGPADPVAHELANRLVGNRPEAPAIEVTARGPVLRARADVHAAVVGGAPPVRVDGRDAPTGTVVPVAAGQRLEVGACTSGLRATVALAGGIDRGRFEDVALGSVAADTLSGLGTPPLVAGDVLLRRHWPGPLAGHILPARSVADADEKTRPMPRRLRVLPGPHSEYFEPGALAHVARCRFVVDPTSDRVGLRIRVDDPPGDLAALRRSGELGSQAMVTGAVQVPPDGVPVILSVDHATHGGYPVVAVVIDADLAILGRCRPGDAVQLVPVGAEEASVAWSQARRSLATRVVGRYPTAAG